MGEQKIEGARLQGPDELVLELGEHCIQTTAQQVHRRLMGGLLEGRLDGPAVEGAVELLSRFLAQEDFGAIRGADADLAGDRRAEVRVWRAGDAVHWTKTAGHQDITDRVGAQ